MTGMLTPSATLERLAREGELLGSLFPTSHAIRNEVTALRLLQTAFPNPAAEELRMARECVDRINVAIVTTAPRRQPPTRSRKFTARPRTDQPMATLILETILIDLPASHQHAFQEELKSAGCSAGMVYIGYIKAVPDSAYVLWHLAGEMPVTMMVPRAQFQTVESTRDAARDFVLRWNQRIG